jgi:DNA-binding XRE family transcriptional regulator
VRKFVDFQRTEAHIHFAHPEISIEQISKTLAEPDEVRKSHARNEVKLFCDDHEWIKGRRSDLQEGHMKINIHYDAYLDYLEVFMKSVPNHEESYKKFKDVSLYKSERTNEIVGYSFENASKSLIAFQEFDPIEKLAVLLKMARLSKQWSQDEAAKKISVSLRHFQRLEAGQDTTLTQLQEIMRVFPETDFTSIFGYSKKVS